MSRLVWDAPGERLYETGVKMGVLYPISSSGAYDKGVSWNGLTAITEKPSGAEATDLYADDTKYLSLLSTETFGATIEAYTYPDEFGECDGTAEVAKGITIGQQARKVFGLCYRTVVGNDVDGNNHGYKLHLIWGARAIPSEKAFASIGDSSEPINFSWEINTTPITVDGHMPTASMIIDSTKVDKQKLASFENILYGSESSEAKLPTPAEVIAHFGATELAG